MIGAGRIGFLGVALVAAGCALPPWIGHPPVFPAGAASWEIPLYEPLTGFGPKVIATVCGPAPPAKPRACEEVLMYVDSGSSHSALPAATFARLGIETSGSRFATIENAAGETRAWSGGLVPEVRVGDLALSQVVAVVYDGTAILGADVLTAHGWRLDLDRGLLVLGAPPASPSPVARLPIRDFPARTTVDLSVEGRVVPLLLDTGAAFTVVDGAWLKAAGLPLRSLAHGWPLSERDRNLRLGEATEASLRLADIDLGRRQLVAHPRVADGPDRGMLGLDLLADYAFGVSAAGALELVPRAPSPLPTAGERIGRWRDLARCPGLAGCVAAQIEQSAGLRIRIRVASAPSRGQRYLFGCADAKGRPGDHTLWIEIGLRAPAAGAERVVDVAMPEPLVPRWKAACAELVLLDVNPVLEHDRPLTGDAEGRWRFGFRHLRLD